MGVFNKTIIPLALVGCEMIMAVREGNALQGVSRWFRRIQRILRFHIDKYQPLRERERDLFQNRKRKRLSHMIANVKFHVTRARKEKFK